MNVLLAPARQTCGVDGAANRLAMGSNLAAADMFVGGGDTSLGGSRLCVVVSLTIQSTGGSRTVILLLVLVLVLILEDYLTFFGDISAASIRGLRCRRAALGGQAFGKMQDDVTGFVVAFVWKSRWILRSIDLLVDSLRHLCYRLQLRV